MPRPRSTPPRVSSPKKPRRGGVDKATVKAAAAGRWPDLLPDLAGIDPALLDGKPHPCPWCGEGDDRFRLIDREDGAVRCNVCFPKECGDGFAAVMKATGCDFPAALAAVADRLGIAVEPAETAPPATAPADAAAASFVGPSGEFADKFRVHAVAEVEGGAVPVVLDRWCKAKPPVTPDAARTAGVVTGTRAKSGRACVAFPARKSPGDEPCGWLTLPADGGRFGKDGDGPKDLSLSGGKDGWVFTCPPAEWAAAETVVRVEGIGDALALYPHLPAGWAVVTNIGGAGSGRVPVGPFKGKRVLVIGDADTPGQAGAAKFAERVGKGAAFVAVAPLPFEVTPTGGRDVRDLLNDADDPAAAVADLLAGATEFSPGPSGPTGPTGPTPPGEGGGGGGRSDPRAVVEVVPDEFRTNDDALAALAAAGGTAGAAAPTALYRRGTVLVRVVAPGPETAAGPAGGLERPSDAAVIVPLKPAHTRDALTRVARFTREKSVGNGETETVPAHPPGWCVSYVHEHGRWPGLPPLDGIAAGPVLRPDGTVLTTPGYDPATALLLPAAAVRDVPPVPTEPTRDDAGRAAADLLDVVGDFPFAAPEHAAAWVAGTLTPLARPAFAGPAPLFLIDAPTRGSGKGLLADVTGLVALGRPAAVMTNPRDDEEARKRITALALAGDPVVLIDNIDPSDRLGGASLDAALTATVWRDRVLGESRIVTLPLRMVWFATGNNVALAGDTARRVVHVRLDPGCERPEERTDFRHPDLKAHVREHRGRLLAAGLTILRAYVHAGRPEPPGGRRTLGSFEGWCSLVRDAVVWAGLADPLDTRTELVETADRGRQALAALLDGLDRADPGGGLKAVEIVRRLSDSPLHHPDLLDAVQEMCDMPGGKMPGSRALGNRLRTVRGTVCGGRALDCREVSGVARWFVRPVAAPAPGSRGPGRGSGGSGGSDSGPGKLAPAAADSGAAGSAHGGEGKAWSL